MRFSLLCLFLNEMQGRHMQIIDELHVNHADIGRFHSSTNISDVVLETGLGSRDCLETHF